MERLERFKTEKKYKSIFKGYMARNLLRLGNPISDIKADKKNPDRTIFIFEETEKFIQDLTTLTTVEKQ
jgi:hypothetical protein